MACRKLLLAVEKSFERIIRCVRETHSECIFQIVNVVRSVANFTVRVSAIASRYTFAETSNLHLLSPCSKNFPYQVQIFSRDSEPTNKISSVICLQFQRRSSKRLPVPTSSEDLYYLAAAQARNETARRLKAGRSSGNRVIFGEDDLGAGNSGTGRSTEARKSR